MRRNGFFYSPLELEIDAHLHLKDCTPIESSNFGQQLVIGGRGISFILLKQTKLLLSSLSLADGAIGQCQSIMSCSESWKDRERFLERLGRYKIVTARGADTAQAVVGIRIVAILADNLRIESLAGFPVSRGKETIREV